MILLERSHTIILIKVECQKNIKFPKHSVISVKRIYYNTEIKMHEFISGNKERHNKIG